MSVFKQSSILFTQRDDLVQGVVWHAER